jgi:hypothetical protein
MQIGPLMATQSPQRAACLVPLKRPRSQQRPKSQPAPSSDPWARFDGEQQHAQSTSILADKAAPQVCNDFYAASCNVNQIGSHAKKDLET